MSDSMTPEEVKDAMLTEMGPQLGVEFYELWNEVIWLHNKWLDYRSLYAKENETVDLLNEAAPQFFYGLQFIMWEDTLMHLCRITDPPQSCGHDNLVLRRLHNLVTDTNLKSTLSPIIDDIENKTAFARDWRHRRLAHLDLALATARITKPLEIASRQLVEDALSSIRNFMNGIDNHYRNSTTPYEHGIQSLGGVGALIYTLQRGVDAQRSDLE